MCNKKAVFNLKHVDGKADVNGPVVQLGICRYFVMLVLVYLLYAVGAEEKYFPTCYECYRQALLEVNQCPGHWNPYTNTDNSPTDKSV